LTLFPICVTLLSLHFRGSRGGNPSLFRNCVWVRFRR
jgi:hypothetical protein